MSSRGPAANLRPVSRSAVTAFSLGPSEPACEPVRLPDPAAVSQTRQAQAPPPVRRISPHLSLRPVPSSRSASAASRLQPAIPDCVPHPSPSGASQVALGGLYRHVMCGPPELSETRTRQRPRVRVVGFPQAQQAVSTPIVSTPGTRGVSVPYIAQRSDSRHLSQSPVAHKPSRSVRVPSTHRRRTGRQCPKQLVSRHPSQFPVDHRPSLRAQVTAWPREASSCPRDQRPSRRAQGIRRPSPGAPRATAPLHRPPAPFDPAGPAPGQAPSTAPSGPPGADPDPGPRLRHRGYEHWPTSPQRLTGQITRVSQSPSIKFGSQAGQHRAQKPKQGVSAQGISAPTRQRQYPSILAGRLGLVHSLRSSSIEAGLPSPRSSSPLGSCTSHPSSGLATDSSISSRFDSARSGRFSSGCSAAYFASCSLPTCWLPIESSAAAYAARRGLHAFHNTIVHSRPRPMPPTGWSTSLATKIFHALQTIDCQFQLFASFAQHLI
jgi:hypothetical protein